MRSRLFLIPLLILSVPVEAAPRPTAPRKSAALRAAEAKAALETRRADEAEARAEALAAELAALQRPTPIVFAEAPLILIDAPPPPVQIPAAIRTMLDASFASGNDGEVTTVVKYARNADPASGDLVLAAANKWRADRARARQAVLAEAGPFELWSGRAEVGGYITTGNSDTIGATGVLDIQREGLRWRHKLRAQADYQESLGVVSRERYLIGYEPNLKLDARRYFYGAAQYESDRLLGYDSRYSVSAGAGYRAIQSPQVKLDLELGPAFRATDFTDRSNERSLATRGRIDFAWKVRPGLTLTQAASAYLEHYNSTVSSNTALAAKLLGPLSAQLSYAVQYESDPPPGRKSTDTTSRASLVYSF